MDFCASLDFLGCRDRTKVQVTLRWWRVVTEVRPAAQMDLTEDWTANGITTAVVVTSIVPVAEQGCSSFLCANVLVA